MNLSLKIHKTTPTHIQSYNKQLKHSLSDNHQQYHNFTHLT